LRGHPRGREADTITGSNNPDRIAGMEGNDTITQPAVFGDSDEIYGDEGNDTITDTIADADRDTIYGDEGNDTIDVRDGDLGPDTVDCGAGRKDKVFFNEGDTVAKNCEIKKPGFS
jgi:Ca2+-binding RTX toxin-like protein